MWRRLQTVFSYIYSHLTNQIRRLLFWYLRRHAVKLRGGPVYHLTAGIVVKLGAFEDLRREAESTRYAREHTDLPIPRVYDLFRLRGRKDEGCLIMEYMPGTMLQRLWRELTPAQKSSVISQVKNIISVLRSLPQPGPKNWIGSSTRGSFNDTLIGGNDCYGPFENESELHDYRMARFDRSPWNDFPSVKKNLTAIRRKMPEHSRIVFTHGDINRRNILINVKGAGPDDAKITALVDWAQAGWLPEYWEKTKILFETGTGPDWVGWDEVIEGYEEDLAREVELSLIRGGGPW